MGLTLIPTWMLVLSIFTKINK